MIPSSPRTPLSERPSGDLIAGLVWCAAIAVVAFVSLGRWFLTTEFNLLGLLLLVLFLLFVGIPAVGVVRIARELHHRRAR